jgi:choline transport protein
LTYIIPLVALLLSKRKFEVPGPFRLGKYGWAVNIAAIAYMSFQGVFFVFPYGLPVEVESMSVFLSSFLLSFLLFPSFSRHAFSC